MNSEDKLFKMLCRVPLIEVNVLYHEWFVTSPKPWSIHKANDFLYQFGWTFHELFRGMNNGAEPPNEWFE